MATGGINLENARDFIAFGVEALGVGGALIPKANDEFERCGEVAQRFLQIVREARATR
jgi:2-keto-3-deoxy-6-phosphogluconate aldolase